MKHNNGVLIVLASNDAKIKNQVELCISTYDALKKQKSMQA